MKDWQFFLAILVFMILLLPIYEPYNDADIDAIKKDIEDTNERISSLTSPLKQKDIDAINENVKQNNELIGTLTNTMVEIRTDHGNTKEQTSGNADIIDYLLSRPYPIPAKITNGFYNLKGGRLKKSCSDKGNKIMCDENTGSSMEITSLGEGYYNIKGKDGYCADEGDTVSCNRVDASMWEKFKIMDVGDGYYNLIGGRKNQYCSDTSSGIACNKDNSGTLERIQISAA